MAKEGQKRTRVGAMGDEQCTQGQSRQGATSDKEKLKQRGDQGTTNKKKKMGCSFIKVQDIQ